MVTTDAQVRRLMEEFNKDGQVELAGIKAGMSRHTAAKYIAAGKLPSEMREPRDWRTRPDPFAEDWPEIAARLQDAPEIEGRAFFEHLIAVKPERYHAGQLRTFQRRLRWWRATEGPPKRIFFAQAHRPGEAFQADFTHATELGITIAGVPFPHLLCHVCLPYSNWEWARACRSESIPAIKRGLQAAVFRIGRIAEFFQTDNSTAATHDLSTGKRGFNDEYVKIVEHFGMKPRTTGVGEKEQNGDIESLNGVLKRRLEQHLILRGSRDFESQEAYEAWIDSVLEVANRLRTKRVEEEMAVMRPLQVSRLPEYSEIDVPVSSWSTIRIKQNSYSVPSQLKGEVVRVHLYDNRLEVFHGTERRLVIDRVSGKNGHRINYRHVIASLVRKPGAFARYRYREDLFPTLTFRRAYDALAKSLGEWKADVEYVKVLHLAANTMESAVEAVLNDLLERKEVPLSDRVKAIVAPQKPEVPDLPVLEVDLKVYDALIEAASEADVDETELVEVVS